MSPSTGVRAVDDCVPASFEKGAPGSGIVPSARGPWPARWPGLSWLLLLLAATLLTSCGTSRERELKDSFLAQLAANGFVSGVERSGDVVTFTGPGVEGRETSRWRVEIRSARVEETPQGERGLVSAEWYADDALVRASGGDSNLPLPLTSNGLAQECWALWDAAARRWSWE